MKSAKRIEERATRKKRTQEALLYGQTLHPGQLMIDAAWMEVKNGANSWILHLGLERIRYQRYYLIELVGSDKYRSISCPDKE